MKAVSILVIIGIASTAPAQWYNGDPDGVNGLSAEFNTLVTDAFLFEDFSHAGGTITDIYGNFYISTNITGYMYEIRSGMSNGFGGTLHASGNTDSAFLQIPNGYSSFNTPGYLFAADIPDIHLAAGVYMLAFSPIGDGTGRSFVATTSGANGNGTINQLNWFHSTHFGAVYNDSWSHSGNGSYGHGPQSDFDFSYGVVPAPASLAVLGLGCLAATRRRHRSTSEHAPGRVLSLVS